QESLRALCLLNELFQLGDLVLHGAAPLRAGCAEHGGGGVEGDAEAVRDLEEREAAELVWPVHPPPGLPRARGYQATPGVVAQCGGAEAEPGGGLADGDDVHVVNLTSTQLEPATWGVSDVDAARGGGEGGIEMTTGRFDTVVIGGGQAGLAVG